MKKQNFTCNEAWKLKYLKIYNLNIKNTGDFFYNKYSENRLKMDISKKSITSLDFQTQLQDDFLFLTDRSSMSHSLEVRTPFLDHELVETVFSLPENLRIYQRTYKPIYKVILINICQKSITNILKKDFHYL